MAEQEFGAKPPESPAGNPPAVEPGQGGTPPTAEPGQKPAADPGAVTDFVEKDGVKYYRSFDKHPEWRGLKDTKTAVSEILEDNGYADFDELVSDLKTGRSLADLIGTSDANKVQSLLDKAQKWDAAEEYWAEQEAKKLEKGETQEETIARLKKEKQELLDAQRTDRKSREAADNKAYHLSRFNDDVSDLVDSTADLTDVEKSILKLHLGVDNPMDEVDIADRKAVRTTAKDAIAKFTEFIKGVRQAAVDAYADGKSKITPTPQAAAEQTQVVNPNPSKVDVKGKSMEEAFATANKLLIEQFNQTLNQ